jgi:hypothetical protein
MADKGRRMKRTELKRKTPLRAKPPARPVRDDPFIAAMCPPRATTRARMAVVSQQPAAPQPKTPDRKSQAIRDSARGEECLVRIPGICAGNPEHTIWSHAPLGAAGKGRGIKSLDVAGAYCCTACDAAIDGQRPLPPGYDRAQALLDWCYGHLRSLVRLRQKGLA